MADPEKTAKPVTDEIATTRNDPDIFAGYLTRLENPDKVLRTESAGQGLKLYDEVDRDPHAGSVLQTRYLAVAGKEWEVLPATDSTSDKAVAEFVHEAIGNLNFTQAVGELMQAALYGHYESEVMWQVKAGRVVPARLVGKHPRRFVFTHERELRMLTPESLIDGVAVPPRKFVVFSFGSADNPYGKGLGQKLWWPVWFKKHGIKLWLVFLEKFGMPTAVGKYPPGTHPDQQKALLEAIEAIQTDTGVKIPDSMKIELLEATRSGNVTHESLCDYMDRQISKAVLGQTATTEGTPGKLGNEDAQDKVRQDIVKADADVLCECLNGSLVRWIVDFNFPAVAGYPKLWLRTQPEADLKALSERDKTLVKDIRLPVAKRYFYDTYNIPEPESGDDLVQPAAAIANTGTAFAERTFSPEQRRIEELVGKQTGQADTLMAGIAAPVRVLLGQSRSLEDFRDRLYATYSEADPSELEEAVARAMLAAELYGRYSVKAKTQPEAQI